MRRIWSGTGLGTCVAAVLLAPVLLAAAPQSLSAETADPHLNATQTLGQSLFVQSCGVCHMKPQLTAVQFAPVLSKDSVGGQEDVMREVISNGTPRMPGFKYHYDKTQIAAIAAYLKTVPAPQAEAPKPARSRENPADAD
jgi:mono/diheme cytochrome c family protein